MDVTTLEAPQGALLSRPATATRPASPPRAPGRPLRRAGRGLGPQARPPRAVPVGGARVLRPTSCTVPSARVPAPAATTAWRLTERGIALVLVAGLLVVTAALTVVGLTAVRVTGERFAGSSQIVLVQP